MANQSTRDLPELRGVYLQRGAMGSRSEEAAIAVLVGARLLPKLQATILVNPDEGTATIEWLQALSIAETMEDPSERALVLIASFLAGQLGGLINDLDHAGKDAVARALEHALA